MSVRCHLCGAVASYGQELAHRSTCREPARDPRRPLKCPGIGRDKDNIAALQFYFSRPVTDDEMRFLHEVVQRAVACMPRTTQ